jgi:hypothetical protein
MNGVQEVPLQILLRKRLEQTHFLDDQAQILLINLTYQSYLSTSIYSINISLPVVRVTVPAILVHPTFGSQDRPIS